MYKDNCRYKVASFKKVSFGQFKKDWLKTFPAWQSEPDEDYMDKVIWNVWQDITLPKRGTVDSAGYDFYCPCELIIKPGQALVIPTGIRCDIDRNWVLSIYPRSGLGFKYGVRLANSVGIIDGDYFFADNEGHIFVKIVNDSPFAVPLTLDKGKAFCQGVFTPYGITYDDDVQDKRTGGLGSTDSNK